LWLFGWETRVCFPSNVKKCIILVGPHTSAWDVVIGALYRSVSEIGGTKFLGKKELFKPPLGFFFRWLEGVPVDRISKNNLVSQVVDLFNSHNEFRLAMSPEGTRQKVDRLRTGFYYMAKGAGVPIIMCALDFKNKTAIFSEPFYPSENERVDLLKIIEFFSSIQGKNPELGMGHLIQRE